MWSRSVAAAGLLAAGAAICQAQNPNVYARAVPPDKAALDRLNLRTEWALNLPVEGRRDTIELVQTFDDQLFVQTRTGLLVAVDARTGQMQWSRPLGSGGYATVYPVAVNARYVVAAHLTRLYAFYRYTGVVEFSTDLGTPPTAGLAADTNSVYATLTTRPGASGAERIAAYDLPNPIVLADPAQVALIQPNDPGKKLVNPVDELARRYPSGVVRRPPVDEVDRPYRPNLQEAPLGGMSGSRTPSLAVTSRVTPPYRADVLTPTPSLVVVPSFRQPYRLRDETLEHNQRTPSISTIPPSIAGALALADLRPRGVEPRLRWEYGMDVGTNFRLTQTPDRVWAATTNGGFLAIAKKDKTVEVAGKLSDAVAAAPAQAGTTGYVPLADGSLLAVDLAGGNLSGGPVLIWRTNVGGLLNRTPVVTEDAVYAAGDNSGIVRVERATGAVTWRTDRAIDRVVAVNQDFVYAQDRQGRAYVFDARRANGGPGRAVPLSSIDLSSFNVPVTNTATDRAYFAADNGLLICLRDASAKYATAVRVAPAVTVNPVPHTGVNGLDGGPVPKKDDVPPKKDDTPPPPKSDDVPPK